MKTCKVCVLPETFPGIRFNREGVCNYCVRFAARKSTRAEARARAREKFLTLLERVRRSQERASRPYDVIAAYSGGKDSSYLLKVLTSDFTLRVLAVTFNQGFLSSHSLGNIRACCEALGVDHWMITPNEGAMRKAFRDSDREDIYPPSALQRASSICNTCMHLVKALVLKKAIEMGIPLIAYGWSPGQAPMQSAVMPWNPSMLRKTQAVLSRRLGGIMGKGLRPYLLQERHYEMLRTAGDDGGPGFLYNVHPLAFLGYDEQKIVNEIRGIGWEPPADTDSNSTNCLLNSFSVFIHQKRLGYHPYALEIAGLVREGYMSREEGLEKLAAPPDPGVVDQVRERLGL